MGYELRLLKDEKTVFCMPLTAEVTSDLVEAERDLEKLASLFSLASSERRLRVMLEFTRRNELRFSDLMRITLNPKIVQDCLEPLMREGFVTHQGRGEGYRLSEKGLPMSVAMIIGIGKILEAVDREGEVAENE